MDGFKICMHTPDVTCENCHDSRMDRLPEGYGLGLLGGNELFILGEVVGALGRIAVALEAIENKLPKQQTETDKG